MKNGYKSHRGRSGVARKVITSGAAGATNGIMPNDPKKYGGGSKKGGSGPTATAFMRPTYMSSANADYPTTAGNKNYEMKWYTSARPWGGLQYVNS